MTQAIMKTKTFVIFLLTFFFLTACVPAVTVTPTLQPTNTPVPVLKTSHISGQVVYSRILSSHEQWIVVQIFLKNLDTGVVTQLTNSGIDNDLPKWSPDGSKIMYLSWSKENSSDIYIMDKDGKNQRPLIASSADEFMADWSPDGKKIAYVSNKDGDYKIYVIDLQTQNTVKLTNDSMRGFSPEWSSDGKQISFISNSSDNKWDTRSQVFIMNADGTNIRQMMEYNLDHFDGSPVWCPDNSCIIFTRNRGPLKLMILDISNKSVTVFLDKVFGPEIQEADIARSPTSGYITFSAGETFYAMDMKTREIYPLDVKGAFHLSLYP
jgi:Tol biopolymer transport system component